MMSRRRILQTGAALPAASLAASLAAPLHTAFAESAVLALERFVYDVRFAESFDIAMHASDTGLPLSPIADDLMDLWYDELDLRWRKAPTALAGVTMPEALFVLETLAMDRQMRVVYRGEHSAVEHGRIVHKLVGPSELIDRIASRAREGAWEAELARAMVECPLGRPDAAEVSLSTSAPGLSTRDVPLVSWIIAPRSAVAMTIPS